MTTYKIIPLEWATDYTPTNSHPKVIAKTVFGDYTIIQENDTIDCYFKSGHIQWLVKTAKTIKTVKDAAQADYVKQLEKLLIKV